MSFLRTLALLLVALAGFSVGAVLGQGAKSASRSDIPGPCLADFAHIFLCWTGVIVSVLSRRQLVRHIHLKLRWHRLPRPETQQALELREGPVEGPRNAGFATLKSINHSLTRGTCPLSRVGLRMFTKFTEFGLTTRL